LIRIDLKVHPSHIRMALPETIDARGTRLPASACRIINMQLAKNPRRFALWQGADNLQNLRFPDLGIPCPFMLTWTTALEEQTKSQSEAFRKDQDLSKRPTQPTLHCSPTPKGCRGMAAYPGAASAMKSRSAIPTST
jgi:conjugal transfer ATP-binding protein TraC